ncbi:MAG: prephenate dehydrogenase [Lachnospiraceae bacterium]|jgi:prephenate dehydrogenase|nr:prephenate dehydrogenase [Lachnospiraceae bacterium]
MSSFTCGFIGLGLIGGSIAKALKKYQPDITILAYDIAPQALKEAVREGIVDLICKSACDPAFSTCDYLFMCAPVSENDKNLKALKNVLSADCILTDVGSVKHSTHAVIEALGLSDRFIGGHPMAGSEKTGYANANPLLLENAYYILTPTADVSSDKVTRYQSLVANLGAIPLILNEEKHDYITAAISHLPHIVAAQLVNLVHDSDSPEGLMKLIAAGGFKDITRIASSSPDMWEAICMTNTENIKDLLRKYIGYLEDSLHLLEERSGARIHRMFAASKEYRDSFSNAGRGPIKKVFALHVDVPDEAGAIAKTATLLAGSDISIQNIGIMHNREYQDGALRIEFYEESSCRKAAVLLENHGYRIYRITD